MEPNTIRVSAMGGFVRESGSISLRQPGLRLPRLSRPGRNFAGNNVNNPGDDLILCKGFYIFPEPVRKVLLLSDNSLNPFEFDPSITHLYIPLRFRIVGFLQAQGHCGGRSVVWEMGYH